MTRSTICVSTRSIQCATLFLPQALPPLLLTRTSRHIPCLKVISRPCTSYLLYGLVISSSFWNRTTAYPTSSLPHTSDFIRGYNWMAAHFTWKRICYIERWWERREHDPCCRCRCVSHFHVSSFVADVSETDHHGTRHCRPRMTRRLGPGPDATYVSRRIDYRLVTSSK
jgi:hypothetical protein